MTVGLLTCLLLLIGACNDTGIPVGYNVSEVEMKLDVDAGALGQPFSAEGGSKTIKVNSTNVDWKISSLPSWIAASTQSGNNSESIRLTAEKNYDTENGRIGLFYVESDVPVFKWKADCSVSQDRALKYARPKNSNLVFDGAGGSQTVEIDANSDYKAIVSQGKGWLSVTKGNGFITVRVNVNDELQARHGRIDISTTDENGYYIDVTQRLANVDVSTEQLTFTCEGGSYQVRVQSEVDWSITNSESWLEVSPEKSDGVRDTCITINAIPNQTSNARNGFVYLWTGSNKRVEIPVVQEGFYMKFIIDDTVSFSMELARE